ncbi:MAG: sulfoquinovosidase [Chloroflexota bacterium]
MGNRRQRERLAAPAPEPDAPVRRQAAPESPTASSPVMGLQQSAGNRAVQRLVQRNPDDEWDLDNLPQRGRSSAIDASASLRQGEVTPDLERAAFIKSEGAKLQQALAAEKAQKASGTAWEGRQAAFAQSSAAHLAPARLQSKTAALVMDSRRLRSEAEHGPSEESRVLAEQAAKRGGGGGGGGAASPASAPGGGPDLAAAQSAGSTASDLGIAATATSGVLESGVGGLGGFIGGNVSGATQGDKLTTQGLKDTGSTGLVGGVGGIVGSGLKFGQASELDAQAAALASGNAAQKATSGMLSEQAGEARTDAGLGMVGGLSSAIEGGGRIAASLGAAGGEGLTAVMGSVTPGLSAITGGVSAVRDAVKSSEAQDRADDASIAIEGHLKRTGGQGTAAIGMADQLVRAKERQSDRAAASAVGNTLSAGAGLASIIPGGQAVGGALAGGAAVWKAGQAIGETVVDERQARDVQATRRAAGAGDIEAIERLAQIDPAIAQYAPAAAMQNTQDYAQESALLNSTVKAATGMSDEAVRSGASNPASLAQAISTDTGQSTEQATIGMKMSAGWDKFKKKIGAGPSAPAPSGPDANISAPVVDDAAKAQMLAKYGGATIPAGPQAAKPKP